MENNEVTNQQLLLNRKPANFNAPVVKQRIQVKPLYSNYLQPQQNKV